MVGPSFNQTRRTAVITISHCKPIDIDRIRLLLPTSCCYWADKNCTDLCIVWLYNPFLVKNYNIFLMISYWKSPNNTSNIVQLSKLIVLKKFIIFFTSPSVKSVANIFRYTYLLWFWEIWKTLSYPLHKNAKKLS